MPHFNICPIKSTTAVGNRYALSGDPARVLAVLQHCNTIYLEQLGAALQRGPGGARMLTAFVKELVQCLSCDARDSNAIIQLAQSILLARKQSVPVPPARSQTSSSNSMHGIDRL